ncbi:MAG: hypothetical protein ACBR50_03905, partial [Microcoleus sp.]
MMRLLPTIAALSAALTPLMAEVAFSLPMPRTTDFPTTSNPQVNVPVCYIETSSGTTFDLVSLCGKNTTPAATNNRNTTTANPNAANPPNPSPNGITRDAAGTPITTPAGTNPNNPNNLNNPSNPNTNPNNLNNPSNPNTNPNNLNNPSNPNTNPNNLNNPSNPNTNPN